MMQDIFEKKESPFYHFGYLTKLSKIPYDDFFSFLKDGFLTFKEESEAEQQKEYTSEIVSTAILELTQIHDIDYERL